MAAFRGNHTAKIDDAGRLKLPGPFKDLLDEAGVSQFYITSEDGVTAQIWPLPEWEKQEALLAGYIMTPAVDRYLNVTSYYGQQVKMDTQARVVLPQILRASAKLDAEVTVRGKMQYLVVDNLKRLEAEVAVNGLTLEDRQSLATIVQRRADN